KSEMFYVSVVAAALSDAPSAFMTTMLVAAIFAIEFGWYAVVAVAFSTDRARYTYVRGKAWIDRLAAAAIGLLGAKILAELRPSRLLEWVISGHSPAPADWSGSPLRADLEILTIS